MAEARTCGEACSRAAARRSTSSASPSTASTVARCGRPAVRVPVLSNRRTRARASDSSGPPPLTMMPRRADREMPATMAIGAARSRGHGVATTSTARARVASPEMSHATAARARVSGTKYRAYRSASRTNGAFAPARLLHEPDDPGVGARIGRGDRLEVERGTGVDHADETGSPISRSTWRLSPVSADSSRVAPSLRMTPSTGTTSPGRTRRRSPTWTAAIGTISRTSSR